jgi:hypothetical protein
MMLAQTRRKAALLYLCSFLIFATFPTVHATNARHVPGDVTDHMAHWGSAILLAFRGLDVYRQPMRDLCTQRPEEDPGVSSEGITCTLPDHPGIRPFGLNWQQYPRVYPPGAMLFSALPALLFGISAISFDTANLLMILQCLMAAHMASFLLLLCLWREESEEPGPMVTVRQWNVVVSLFLMPAFHLFFMCWTLLGLYDSISIAGVLAGVLLLRQQRPVEAFVAVSFGIFTHYRGLWFLPLLGWSGWEVLRLLRVERRPRTFVLLGLAGVMLALSLGTFRILLPVLYSFPINNPVNVAAFQRDPSTIVVQGLPIVLLLAAFVANRQWLTASVAFWQVTMLVQTREVRPWHALFAVGLLGIAGTERRAAPLAALLAAILIVTECTTAFGTSPLSGQFLSLLLQM